MSDHDDNTIKVLTRLAVVNQHGELGTDESNRNLELAELMAAAALCKQCDLQTAITPAGHQRWIVEHMHDPDCPHYDGNDAA